jgi:hypothetical protein
MSRLELLCVFLVSFCCVLGIIINFLWKDKTEPPDNSVNHKSNEKGDETEKSKNWFNKIVH